MTAHKKEKKKRGKTKAEKLSPKEELFCQYYSKSGEFFGNARRAYAAAFDRDVHTLKQERVCDVMAWRLLRRVAVIQRCQELLDERISDEVVDRELEYVVKQKENLHAKVSAISEVNKVRGRITQKHKFEGVDTETLANTLAEIIAGNSGDSKGA